VADTFVDYAKAHAPPWLLGEWGEKFLTVLGESRDAKTSLAREACKARMSELAPADALVRIGADRVVLQAPGETDAAFRARLLTAFDIWHAAGTEQGIKDLLGAAGCVTVVLTEDQDVAGALGHWARFLIDVFPPHPYTAPIEWAAAGPTTWGEESGVRWGFGDSTAVDYTRVVTRRWKPAHTRCLGVRVTWSGVPGYSLMGIEDDAVSGLALPTVSDPNSFFAFTFPFWFAG
jgi:hypothetical protein